MTTICYAWDPNLNVCIGGEQTNQQTRTKSQSAGHELREAQQHECTQLWPPSKLITDCCWDPINKVQTLTLNRMHLNCTLAYHILLLLPIPSQINPTSTDSFNGGAYECTR